MTEWSEYAKSFIALLAIVNPIGMIPVFVSMTAQHSGAQRRRIGTIAAATVLVVLTVSLVMGEGVLGFFGISISSFRVAGGILIMMMAMTMIHGSVSRAKQTPEEASETAERENIAVVPLGIPLLAGPGAISAVIIYSHRQHNLEHYLYVFATIVLVAVVTWLTLRAAPTLSRLLGETGINVVGRIMGLIMAAIGVEFIVNGLKQLLPGLAG